jgi:hypothetical protein
MLQPSHALPRGCVARARLVRRCFNRVHCEAPLHERLRARATVGASAMSCDTVSRGMSCRGVPRSAGWRIALNSTPRGSQSCGMLSGDHRSHLPSRDAPPRMLCRPGPMLRPLLAFLHKSPTVCNARTRTERPRCKRTAGLGMARHALHTDLQCQCCMRRSVAPQTAPCPT